MQCMIFCRKTYGKLSALQGRLIAIREAKCLEQMYPDIFEDIKAGDKFAGRIKMSLIGFSPEPGGLGYYCNNP